MGVQLQGEQPPLRFDVQPVQIVGDASALSSPLLAPIAWFGSSLNVTPGNFGTFAIRSNARGGSFVVSLRATAAANVEWVWRVNEVRTAIPGEFGLTAQNMTPEEVTAEVRIGQPAVALGTFNNPNIQANRQFFSVDEFYLRPGNELLVQNQTANDDVALAVLIQDVPAMIPRN